MQIEIYTKNPNPHKRLLKIIGVDLPFIIEEMPETLSELRSFSMYSHDFLVMVRQIADNPEIADDLERLLCK